MLVVAIAAVDALRSRDGDDEQPSREGVAPQPGSAERARLVARLGAAGVSGTLVYTDDLCALRGVAFPSLRRAPHPAGLSVGCEFEVSADGLRIAPRRARWSPASDAYALCRRSVVDVHATPGGRPRQQYDGCVPAWRPDAAAASVLTVIRDGALLEVRPGCAGPPPCERTLLSPDAIARAAAHHVNAPEVPGPVVPVVEDVAWLSASRVALLVSVRFRGRIAVDLVAVYEGTRLLGTTSVLDDRLTELEASPSGSLLVARPDKLLSRSGESIGLPPNLSNGLTLALSPDERWLAVATRTGDVALIELEPLLSGSTGTTEIRLPISVRDLAWR